MSRLQPHIPGQYFDAETGKHYNYFRDYDPSIGRYTQSDPIGIQGGLSTFGYVSGTPLSKVDMKGLQARRPPAQCEAPDDVCEENRKRIQRWMETCLRAVETAVVALRNIIYRQCANSLNPQIQEHNKFCPRFPINELPLAANDD